MRRASFENEEMKAFMTSCVEMAITEKTIDGCKMIQLSQNEQHKILDYLKFPKKMYDDNIWFSKEYFPAMLAQKAKLLEDSNNNNCLADLCFSHYKLNAKSSGVGVVFELLGGKKRDFWN